LQLNKERELLEKRFMPGQAPGDIQEENQELVRRIQELKSALDSVMQETAVAQKKLENECLLTETLSREIDSYKQALTELEYTMIDMGGYQQQQQQ
jgi:cell division septum initiation protein DivIVA